MLQDILREHALMLRSQADELDQVAAVLDQTTPSPSQDLYTPRLDPIDLPDTIAPMTVAEPDGHVDVTYNLNLEPGSRINVEASLKMAEHDARQGKIVCLDFGNRKEFWTKETFTNG